MPTGARHAGAVLKGPSAGRRSSATYSMVMRSIPLLLCALLLAGPAFAGEEESPAAEAGHAVKETVKAIGHGTRDATRAVGHSTRKVTTAIGHGFRDAAQAIGHGTRNTVHTVGDAVSKETK